MVSAVSPAEPAISPSEWLMALIFAAVMEAGVLLLLALSDTEAPPRISEASEPREVPIAVQPIMDELPLLKLGSKVRPKLPDMWKKQAPVKRHEEQSAPSEAAQDSPEAIPTSKLALRDAEAPPPDAELVKELDEEFTDATPPDATPAVEGEGSPDGVKEGTETDPLKARWVSEYRGKIIGWFDRKFSVPDGSIPCEELKALSAAAIANVSPDLTVTGYQITRPSGNPVFDARVKAALDSAVGSQLPPPPPLLKNPIGSTQPLNYNRSYIKCD